MSKVLAIVRASTEKQETESQKKELFDYLHQYGYSDSDFVVIEVAGASARKKNAKYLQMLDNIKSTILQDKDITAVGLWNLDRLGRVDDSLIEMKNWFINHKIQLYCKSPSLVLLKSDGTVDGGAEIAYGVFASLVKQQTEDLFNKWHRGKKRNSENGKYNGGNVIKFGYKLDSNNYIVPNWDKTDNVPEAELVQIIYKEYATGKYSVEKLTDELNSRGYKNRGKSLKAIFVSKILNSTAYKGYTNQFDKNNVQLSKRKFIPIIDDELWNKVESIRKGNTLRIKTKESKYNHFASGLLICGCCGGKYYADSKYYVCYNNKFYKKRGLKVECKDGYTIKVEIIDNILWDVVQVLHLDYMDNLDEQNIDDYKNQIIILNSKIATANKEIIKLANKANNAKILFVNLDITKKEYDKIKGKLTADSIRLQADITRYTGEIDRLEQLIYDIQNPDENVRMDKMLDTLDEADGLTNQKKQELVKKYIKVCTVKRTGDKKRSAYIHVESNGNSSWDFLYQAYDKKHQIMRIVNGELKDYFIDTSNRKMKKTVKKGFGFDETKK